MAEAIVYGIAALVTALCVGIHYESLRFLAYAPIIARGRHGVLAVVVALLAVHVVEIWIFACAYHLLADTQFGSVQGATTFLDHVYYSASVYTTLGFGDLVPAGALRALTGTEALTGLALITWSASFTFLEMQRLWQDR